jgi:beta-phosphoglucomutase
MKYKAVIFDLDGVIISSDKYHYLAWKKIADELGIYFDEEINNRLRGISRMESLDIILELFSKKLTQQEKLDYADKKNSYYRQLLLENMSPEDLNEEVKDTLDKIREKGIHIGIGSSSKNARLILRRIGLDNYFDAISDGTNITHSKPHPEVFLKASEYLGESNEECLVVEDAKSGIQAALAANMDCAAIGDGIRYNLATYNLNTFSDLLSIV